LLAEEAEIPRILVPGAAATFCALGAVSADLRRDFVRSLRRRLDPASTAELAALFAALNDDARTWLSGEGDLARSVDFQHAVDMRYAGQAYELRVPLPDGAAGQALLTEAFHAAHERLYGFRDIAAPIELSTARLAIIGRVDPVALPHLARRAEPPEPRVRRPVFLGDGWVEAAVYDRAALGAEQQIAGPAIIEQEDTTTLVLSGWQVRVDDHGNLDLTREGGVP
jgi:N-methylhydantoinase A